MHNSDSFKVDVHGVAMNNHIMNGSTKFSVAFIDSGTTFSYFPPEFIEILRVHFLLFCDASDENCKGELELRNSLCFGYDSDRFTDGPKKYFDSFPTLNFKLQDVFGEIFNF